MKCILVPEESKILLVQKFSTGFYSPHYNAYCVYKTSDYCLVNVNDLAIHDVFQPYDVFSLLYVVVRSHTQVDMFI